ncbi:MAG: D-2-hydroxyacid dehydrogenase [Kiritimatiellia bacterium]
MKSPNPSICILDAFTTNPGDLSWEALASLGNLTVYDRTSPSERLERAEGHHILITNKVVLDKGLLCQVPDCELVCLLSTGTNAVDLDYCRERGIPVCNIPAYSTDSVAELTFALLLDWARGVHVHGEAVREGAWCDSADFCFSKTPQRELAGKTLGLVGFGEIARAVARIAAAFGMKLLACTPHPEGKPEMGQDFVTLETLLAESDVVSLHCPLTEATQGLINEDRIAMMRPGAVLINTGRGGLLDEAAVAAALKEGVLGAALLDVLSSEPPRADNPLLSAPNCTITPHIAWATRAARERLISILVENVTAFLEGNPKNVVNPA